MRGILIVQSDRKEAQASVAEARIQLNINTYETKEEPLAVDTTLGAQRSRESGRLN